MKDLYENPLIVSETFYGLQGEGTKMGYPSVFVRLGGCSLSCPGFNCIINSPKSNDILKGCDTIYSVHPDFKDFWFKYTTDFLIKDIYSSFPEKLIYTKEKIDLVFTGGEPLLQHKNKHLINCIEYFISRGHEVWIETNGTIPIDFNRYDIYKKCNMSISVKMSLSGEPESKRWKPSIVNEYIKRTKKSYFKFVMSKDNIQEEKREIFEFLNSVPSYAPVYCMSLGSDQETLIKNAKTVYNFASENGFRYSDRIHIRIHDDLRGV